MVVVGSRVVVVAVLVVASVLVVVDAVLVVSVIVVVDAVVDVGSVVVLVGQGILHGTDGQISSNSPMSFHSDLSYSKQCALQVCTPHSPQLMEHGANVSSHWISVAAKIQYELTSSID